MSTMIERVARALTETQIRTANELFKLTNPRRVRTEDRIMAAVESGWRLNEKDARAAIKAMMDPTGEVQEAGWQSIQSFNSDAHLSLDEVGQVFTAMVRSALKDEE